MRTGVISFLIGYGAIHLLLDLVKVFHWIAS